MREAAFGKKTLVGVILAGGLLFSGCASGPAPYGPADDRGGFGYQVQKIESDRLRVSYRARDAASARDNALRRASEVTLEEGADWFRVVGAYTDAEQDTGGRTSVSLGGSSGSYGSGVGVGIGIGLGGGRARETVHDLEILIGSGPKPDGLNVYDARAVRDAMLDVDS